VVLKKQIKVLECIRQGKIGGGESHLLSLIENLDRTVYNPVVLSFTDGPMIEQLKQMNVRTAVIHTERPFDIVKWNTIRKWIAAERFDVIHAHGTRANSNILWAARSMGIPVIYTIHGWSFHDDQNKWVKKLRILGEKFLISRSQINISVSQSNKETGIKHFTNFKSVVINNGINLKKFNPENSYKEIHKELSIPPDAVVYLFIARFTHQKQPLVLIDAFLNVIKNHPNLYLIMVGDGEQKEEGISKLKGMDVGNRIQLLPFRQDVPDLLHSADVFVLPSLWEGLPIALLEAMAMSKAIIASKVDGTRELINHKENGYLIETNNLLPNLTNAIVELGTNNALRASLKIGARNTIKGQFDAFTMTKQIENIYQQAIAN
jgi:glycosyltransferase involved in cell wall biosynthesis